MIFNLVIKRGDNNDNYSTQLYHLHNSLIMRIVDITEKDFYNDEGKSETRKVYISLIKSSSIIFSCSVREIYNRVHPSQKQRLILRSNLMWSSPIFSLRSHSLVHSENNSYFVGLGPIRDVDLTYIF